MLYTQTCVYTYTHMFMLYFKGLYSFNMPIYTKACVHMYLSLSPFPSLPLFLLGIYIKIYIYIYKQSLNKAMGVMGRQLRRVLGAWLGACEALGRVWKGGHYRYLSYSLYSIKGLYREVYGGALERSSRERLGV